MSCDKAPYFKKTAIRRILGHTFCAECHEIPSLEISYAEFDIIRIEHYCTNCYQKSLARSLEEPQTREEIAEFYGCIKAEQK